MAGFPNLFLLVGPNTGLGHNSIVFMIEAQLNYVLGRAGARCARAAPAASRSGPTVQTAYNDELQAQDGPARCGTPAAARAGTWTRRAATPRIWPDFTLRFWKETREFDAAAYELTNGTSPARTGPTATATSTPAP